jgi:hypothetical protein
MLGKQGMIRDRLRTVLAALALLPAAVALPSCAKILGYDALSGRTDDGGSPGGDAGDSEVAVDAGPVPVHPPPRPAGDPTPSGKGKTLWFSFKRFHHGSENHAGAKVDDAWREWGYDLDKVCTGEKESKENTGTCRRVDGAEQNMLVDGNSCIDNNFGARIVPILRTNNPNFEKDTNAAIGTGAETWILELEDLDDGADDPLVRGSLYRSTPESTAPKFDGSDVRSVSSESVTAGDLSRPLTTFPNGYLSGNIWVSGDPDKFSVALPVGGYSLPLYLVGAVMTLPLDTSHQSGAGNGLLAGAIPPDYLEQAIKPIAFEAKFCPGTPIYDNLLRTVQQYPDLVADAPNLQDINVTCNAVSVGLGFDVARMQPVTKVEKPPPPGPSPCP